MTPVKAFNGFVLKIHSRCNLNCTYCYMYNKSDTTWRKKPKKMDLYTFERTIEEIRAYAEKKQLPRIHIALHGGEPLLIGNEVLRRFCSLIRATFAETGIDVSLTIQTNGTLLNKVNCGILAEYGVGVGVSLDGTPDVNDKARLDHRGLGSASRVEEGVGILMDHHPDAFSGFLCVLDPASDATATFDYLTKFHPPALNFLFPLYTHDDHPPWKEPDSPETSVGDWLIEAFKRWSQSEASVRVVVFESLIHLLNGGASSTESFGESGRNIVVVETDGALEIGDALKVTADGLTNLGLNITTDSLDDAYDLVNSYLVDLGADSIAPVCESCAISHVCNGGDLAGRFSLSKGFRNPNVYCRDILKLVTHVDDAVRRRQQVLEAST
ncbi:radical SAM protein [uncultured Tateyamaria sp.]|uniref:radical SAM protein n=1 Tax=uncultured Tateyamaria sp. TaxID=455651 RepID=UPI00261F1CFE|nr:radical SAM protein [uncultured Tateyamaria sp.]